MTKSPGSLYLAGASQKLLYQLLLAGASGLLSAPSPAADEKAS